MLSLKKIKSRSSALKRMAPPSTSDLGTTTIIMSTEIPYIRITKYDTSYVATIIDNNVGYKRITIQNTSFDLKFLSNHYDYGYNRYEFINPDTSIKELLKDPELFTENTGVFPVYISNTNNFYSIS
jgi:hypothetical protein